MDTTFEQLEKHAGQIIESYTDDLYRHDRNSLEADTENTPFLHFTGKTGTHIFFMPSANSPTWPGPGEYVPILFGHGTRFDMLDNTRTGVKSMRKHHWNDLVLFYNGLEIKVIDNDEADAIVDRYTTKIRREWKQ